MQIRSLVIAAALAMLAPAAFAQTGNLANPAALNEKAPAVFKAKFETSKGAFVVEVHRDWAPAGADRFYNLVKNGFFDETRFFRVMSDFMAQFGINGDPKVAASWRTARIPDDRVTQSNNAAWLPTLRRDRIRAPPRSSSTSPTIRSSTAWALRPSARWCPA
jgi:peptidyl-prolyl cis-trans isomerase A (cyclophilin A)